MSKFTETHLKGVFIIEPTLHKDSRGYFMESFNEKEFKENVDKNFTGFVQDNESCSDIFTLRGLHYQKGDSSQGKLVRVTKGMVLDVAVDIRPESDTYGDSFSIILSGENKKQLYIPRGFAHGFSVLENNTIFNYKCDNHYDKGEESGFNPFSPSLNIDWRMSSEDAVMSDKDNNWKNFNK